MDFPLKAIYGTDTRQNIYEIYDSNIQEQALSVACLVKKSNLIKEGFSYKLNSSETLASRRSLASGVSFAHEPSIGFGTAFLIAPGYALTAGHCVCVKNSKNLDSAQIKMIRLLFGFQMIDSRNCKKKFDKNEVYKIKKVVDYEHSNDADWALLELTKKSERAPLPLNFDWVKNHEQVDMIGHPSGLPEKYAGNATVMNNTHADFFECNLAAFGGNSGSPVFNAKTREVIGILYRGQRDWDINRDGSSSLHHVTSTEIYKNGYEKCQRVSKLQAKLSIAFSDQIEYQTFPSSYRFSFNPDNVTDNTLYPTSHSPSPFPFEELGNCCCCCFIFCCISYLIGRYS